MKTSERGIVLIKQFEGLRTEAYPDPALGWKLPTIGYGHVKGVKQDDKISEAQATEYLRQDLQEAEAGVSRLVRVELTQNQFDALVSFVFNLGEGNFRTSTLLRKLNARDYTGAAAEFPRWNKAGGKILGGLVKRRAAERALFES